MFKIIIIFFMWSNKPLVDYKGYRTMLKTYPFTVEVLIMQLTSQVSKINKSAGVCSFLLKIINYPTFFHLKTKKIFIYFYKNNIFKQISNNFEMI